MLRSILRTWIKYISLVPLLFLLPVCASLTTTVPSTTECYRSHWPIPFELIKVRRIAQQPFATHTGSQRFVTIFKPGPFKQSLFFVMSPRSDAGSVARSPHIGVMLDTNRNGSPDCFILGGGRLPDKNGNQVPYNFFAMDREGDGQIEEFISEDLDVDGDRLMDQDTRAVLMDPDPEGHFQKGVYHVNDTITPIPKEGSAFLLKKPLFEDPFSFQDNEVTQMTLFSVLHQIWKDLH
jgi:hypothetical protein